MHRHKTLTLTDSLMDYVTAYGVRPHPMLERIRRETEAMGGIARMQIAPDQGAFMQLLIRSIGARRTLEVGTFTGYSALAAALALPPDGNVTCCEIDPDYAAKARSYWAEAGLADRIALRLGPAAETLQAILDSGGRDGFDFAFIDADKTGYDAYYEYCLRLVRPGGLILLDNMLWSGRVADESDQSADTAAIRALTRKIHADERVDACLLTVADGLMLCRRH